MAQQTFTGRKRVRKFFGHIKEVAEMPNLIEVQKASYDQFLMVDEPAGGRLDEGLQAVFRSVFPISDFSGTSMLEFVRYEFEPPKYDVDECRQRRKIPVTSLMFALGLDGEQILSTFYKKIIYKRAKDGWRVPFDATRFRGYSTINDLVDADSGKVVLEAGKKLTVRAARQLQEKGLKALRLSDEELVGNYLAEDLVNPKTGEIYAEAGEEITEKSLKALNEHGYKELPLLDIDHVNIGAYIRNTLAADKNMTREDALFDIYRVMRPGEPPTIDSAQTMFQSLFFDSERYDLSAVGRVKMNMRLELDAPDTHRTLRKEDILAVNKTLVDLRDGKGEIDDIDHLGNRRVRSVGELMENQYRIGLLRMERAIKERMSSVDIDTVMPQDLINAKPAAAAVREFFGSSQLSQFMDQTNPLSEITHKRRLSALGPGGLSRERAGFEVRDVHPTHYGRICPIETPEGPNIGLISSLSCFAQINEYGFIESPYRKVIKGTVIDEVKVLNPGDTTYKVGDVIRRSEMEKANRDLSAKKQPAEYEAHCEYLSAWEEDKWTIAQANVELDEKGHIVPELANARQAGNFVLKHRDEIEYIDVSPKQLVSVAASLIPFLENDDANRALMGSNMQRQAVPLLRADAPYVGTGMERVTARDSGAVVLCKRAGVVDSVDSERIIVRVEGAAHEGQLSREVGADIYQLTKFKRSNQNTCINQKPIVKVGQRLAKGAVLADGPCTDLGELALGRNVLVAFMPWRGYNFEDAILVSEKLVKEDYYTSIHIEEFEIEGRDTKLGPEEITRDIPNISESMMRSLDGAVGI